MCASAHELAALQLLVDAVALVERPAGGIGGMLGEEQLQLLGDGQLVGDAVFERGDAVVACTWFVRRLDVCECMEAISRRSRDSSPSISISAARDLPSVKRQGLTCT